MDNTQWFWLSFAGDPEGFRGVAIVQGADVITAAEEAHRLGCNPGGQVAAYPLDLSEVPTAEFRERLLTKAEVEKLNRALGYLK